MIIDFTKVNFRLATIDDAQIIFELSNDSDVRENSINKEKILWEDHIKWFKSKLNSDDYFIFLAFYENKFIGQVKFDIQSEGVFISISITKDFRGLKLGTPLLNYSLKLFKKYKQGFYEIIAYIKPNNFSSIKSFEKAGFKFSNTLTIKNEIYNKYIYLIA